MTEKETNFVQSNIDRLKNGGNIPDGLVEKFASFNYDGVTTDAERAKVWELFGACFESGDPNRFTACATIAVNLMMPLIKNKFTGTVMLRDQNLSFSDLDSFANECYIKILEILPDFDYENFQTKVAHYFDKPIQNVAINFDRPQKGRSYYMEKKYKQQHHSYEDLFEAKNESLMKAYDRDEYKVNSPEEIALKKDADLMSTILMHACKVQEEKGTFDKPISKENAQIFAICHKFLGSCGESFKKKAIMQMALKNELEKEESDKDLYY